MITQNDSYYWYEISIIKDENDSLIQEKVRIPVLCELAGAHSSVCVYIDLELKSVVRHVLPNDRLFHIPNPDQDLNRTVFMHNVNHVKPPANTTVLFVWWNRNGFEASQKTLGMMNSEGELILDCNPAGKEKPKFWAFLEMSLKFT